MTTKTQPTISSEITRIRSEVIALAILCLNDPKLSPNPDVPLNALAALNHDDYPNSKVEGLDELFRHIRWGKVLDEYGFETMEAIFNVCRTIDYFPLGYTGFFQVYAEVCEAFTAAKSRGCMGYPQAERLINRVREEVSMTDFESEADMAKCNFSMAILDPWKNHSNPMVVSFANEVAESIIKT